MRNKKQMIQVISIKLNTFCKLKQLQMLQILPYLIEKCLQTGTRKAITKAIIENAKTGAKLVLKS